MGYPRGCIVPALAVLSLGVTAAGCSSSQDKSPQGSLSVRFVPSRPFRAGEPSADVITAKVTISAIEARKADGSWVSGESTSATTFNLVTLGSEGVILPAHLLPEGQYGALQLRFSRVALSLSDGEHLELVSSATGWEELIPADFTVVGDRATSLALKVEPGGWLHLDGGQIEFDPDIQFEGILR